MKELVECLKRTNYQVNPFLIANYKKMNLTEMELIMLICLLNESYNPKELARILDLKLPNVLELINSLSEKGLLKIELKKINGISVEVINLDYLYEKLALISFDQKDNNKSSIYDIFERELGRTISPMECEIISSWLKDNSEELIFLALKEAVYNNVSSMRYIDRIINNWNKKGIKTKEDVENSRKEFKKSKNEKIELFDYDWLNDEQHN